GGPAGDDDVVEEGGHRRRDLLVLWQTHPADGAARANDAERGLDGQAVADALEDRLRAEAVRELTDALDGVGASLAHDVRRAELLCEGDPVGMPAEDDDLLRAEPLGGDHAAEPDGAVADDGRRPSGPDLRRTCGMVP